MQQACQTRRQPTVGAEVPERGRGDELDVVAGELPARAGDGAVALGGDGVGDGCLGGEEAVEGVGLGVEGCAVGEEESDGWVR